MNEFADLDAMILEHPAWKNQFFETAEKIGVERLRRIVPEYYFVTDNFPAVLAQLIARVDNGTRFYLAGILYSELGSGIESEGHGNLFRRLCRDIGVADADLARAPLLPETRNLITGLAALYRDSPILASMGGQYALEFQADNMLRSFRRAFHMLENASGAAEGMKFFVVHDKEEPEHIQAMRQALVRYARGDGDMQVILTGARRCLDLFGDFWSGMSGAVASWPETPAVGENKLFLIANRR
jgi:pyrroloquinoline quinone (PQQ) biosynthesis protein C